MITYTCKNCGAPLEVDGTQEKVVCEYCGSTQKIAITDTREIEKKIQKEQWNAKKAEEKRKEAELEIYKAKISEKEYWEAEKSRKKKSKKWKKMGIGKKIAIVAACVIGVMALALGSMKYGVYCKAGRQKSAGEYMASIQTFITLGDYLNCEEEIADLITLIHGEYSEVRKKVLEGDQFDYLKKAEVGDVVPFGVYEQDGNPDKKEPMEWILLKKTEDEILLINRFVLEKISQKNDKIFDWRTDSLRSWMNGTFYEEAFTEAERSLIWATMTETRNYDTGDNEKMFDYVFSLSDSEAKQYMIKDEKRICFGTEHLNQQKNQSAAGEAAYPWSLRNPGSDYGQTCWVMEDGQIKTDVLVEDYLYGYARPAMWLKIQ